MVSEITSKEYNPSNAIYISNTTQAQKYLKYLGSDFLLDVLYDSAHKRDAIVFVFKKCEETKLAKELWDDHAL